MTATSRRDDDPTRPARIGRRAASTPDEMFPLTPPDRRHDPNALADLPEHLRGPARTLIHESSWLQRRIVADQARLDQIRDKTERTPWHQRAQRAELSGRYRILSGGISAAYERLIEIEHQLGGMYEFAESTENGRERSGDHPSRDLARADIDRDSRATAATGIERDEAAERAARGLDHSRSAR